MTEQTYDVAVIGGGPGGYVAAIRAAQLGLQVVLIERAELGGVCLNWGCIPTKALLRSAEVLRLARGADEFGIHIENIEASLERMVTRSRDVAMTLSRGVNFLMRKHGIHVIQGTAALKGDGRISVAAASPSGAASPSQQTSDVTQEVQARHIIIATGARARELPGLKYDGKTVWSYREALMPPVRPDRMLIIGAGAIGVEFASFYSALGIKVTLLEMAGQVLPTEDAEVSHVICKALTEDGVDVRTSSTLSGAKPHGQGWNVTIEGQESGSIDVDVILVAAGVVANTETLGLEHTAVQLDKGHIVVDGCCRTDEPGVYAIGDVAGAPWLAHKASHEAVLVAEHIAGLNVQPLDRSRIPSCVYSHVQAARIGLTESEAVDQGHKVRVGKFPFTANGKALAMGNTEGFVKAVVDADSGELLGAHMVGHDVTEILQSYTVAISAEATEEELVRTVFAHPTMSEAVHEAVLAAHNRALHY